MEYQIFHTLEESENYCSSTSIDEKKSKLLFDSRKDPFNTNSSLWGTSSVEFLKILLCTFYQIRDIYSNYESLNWLEKHGLAHLIVSATSAYVEENDCKKKIYVQESRLQYFLITHSMHLGVAPHISPKPSAQ